MGYLKNYQWPTTCTCGGDLTTPNSLEIWCSVSGQSLTFDSQLDPDGQLEDVEDMVESGHHSATYCRLGWHFLPDPE